MMGSGIARDIHFAVRTLRRSPAFTLTAVLMLAVGIGVNAAVFTVTRAILFNGFPLIAENDRLVYIARAALLCLLSRLRGLAGAGDVVHRSRCRPRNRALSFSGQDRLRRAVRGDRDQAGTFRLVGQQPILGRDFMPADEQPGAAPVAILSYDFWQRRYSNRDSGVIGRSDPNL